MLKSLIGAALLAASSALFGMRAEKRKHRAEQRKQRMEQDQKK